MLIRMMNIMTHSDLMEVASTLKSVNRGASPGMVRHMEARSAEGLDRQLSAEYHTVSKCLLMNSYHFVCSG